MFIVTPRFSNNRDMASHLMGGHKEWLQHGFDDGVFLLAGSLKPDLGGAIMAHNISRADLESRMNGDPFVAEKVVEAEILEIAPARMDERLAFLSGDGA